MKNVLFENDLGVGYVLDGILHIRCSKSHQDKVVAEAILSERLNSVKGIEYPCIGDFRNLKTMTKEARDVYSSDMGHKGISAMAILMNPGVGVMIAKFFMKFNSPKIPTKIFTNEISAKEWVSKFV